MTLTLEEGWYIINGKRCFLQQLLGIWNYWNEEEGWKEYQGEEINKCHK
jgi:hypothetical protein